MRSTMARAATMMALLVGTALLVPMPAQAQAPAAEDWKAARDAFGEALEYLPGSRRVLDRIALCERRLNPALKGFAIVGDAFDPQTGLARTVTVPELGLEMRLVPPGLSRPWVCLSPRPPESSTARRPLRFQRSSSIFLSNVEHGSSWPTAQNR